MRPDEEWKVAATELDLHVREWTEAGRPKELAGEVDGHWMRAYPYVRVGESSGAVSMVEVRFPEPVGPPGLRMRIHGPIWLALKLDRLWKRKRWRAFTDIERSSVVQAEADDPDQLARWMTPDRVDALTSLRKSGPGVEVSAKRVVTRIDAASDSQEILSEIHHLISVAKRLAD